MAFRMRNTVVSLSEEPLSEKKKDPFNLEISKESLETTTYKYENIDLEELKIPEPKTTEDYLKKYQENMNNSSVKPLVEREDIVFDQITGSWKLVKQSEIS